MREMMNSLYPNFTQYMVRRTRTCISMSTRAINKTKEPSCNARDHARMRQSIANKTCQTTGHANLPVQFKGDCLPSKAERSHT